MILHTIAGIGRKKSFAQKNELEESFSDIVEGVKNILSPRSGFGSSSPREEGDKDLISLSPPRNSTAPSFSPLHRKQSSKEIHHSPTPSLQIDSKSSMDTIKYAQHSFKVAVVGASTVGKHSLIRCFNKHPTREEFAYATVGEQDVELNFTYYSCSNPYTLEDLANSTKSAEGFLFMFNLCDKESYELCLKARGLILQSYTPVSPRFSLFSKPKPKYEMLPPAILVGTHDDEPEEREVFTKEVFKETEKLHFASYFEVSSTTGKSVQLTLEEIAKQLLASAKKKNRKSASRKSIFASDLSSQDFENAVNDP